MLRFLIPLILALGTAGPALAERVTYVLETPGVV